MEWEVLFAEEFDEWLGTLDESIQDRIWAHIEGLIMAVNSKDRFAQLPEARRKAILALADQMAAEELTLAELREARRRSQAELAKKLGVQQSAISRIERRADMYLSTLSGMVEAMGGTLEIIARFPDRPPVRINQLKMLVRAASESVG
jgi:TRAP-type C4-dicarboxylate transport system substrate-binding protein